MENIKCPECKREMTSEHGGLPYCIYCGYGMSGEQIMELTGESINWQCSEGWKD